jgi:hypothetical protein
VVNVWVVVWLVSEVWREVTGRVRMEVVVCWYDFVVWMTSVGVVVEMLVFVTSTVDGASVSVFPVMPRA